MDSSNKKGFESRLNDKLNGSGSIFGKYTDSIPKQDLKTKLFISIALNKS